MPRPYEVSREYFDAHLDELVETTFADLQSQFLVLPKGDRFVTYADFQGAYELLRRRTAGFIRLTDAAVLAAARENGLSLLVLRAILGLSPPEWADLARTERSSDVTQGFVRSLEQRLRQNSDAGARLLSSRYPRTLRRIEALVSIAVEQIAAGTPPEAAGTVHRLDKVDTKYGLESLRHASEHDVPYAVLLYERFMGRPFATHRDAVSELVGAVMENAIEERLTRAGVHFRATKRAERVPGFDQVADFFIPDEVSPSVLIEAKITSDDGTARDKVTRIVHLAEERDRRVRAGQPRFELIACVDGRGFGIRRQDMRNLLRQTNGKVFTLATLDRMIPNTRLREFAVLDATS